MQLFHYSDCWKNRYGLPYSCTVLLAFNSYTFQSTWSWRYIRPGQSGCPCVCVVFRLDRKLEGLNVKDPELLLVRGGSTHTLRSLYPASSGADSQAWQCYHNPLSQLSLGEEEVLWLWLGKLLTVLSGTSFFKDTLRDTPPPIHIYWQGLGQGRSGKFCAYSAAEERCPQSII